MNLNVEQKKIIQGKPTGHALIRGVAGSGKTTVAVHKIPFLIDNYCFDKDDKILMVTYNKTLVKYIKHIYEKVDKDTQLSFDSIVNNKEKVNINNIDRISYSFFAKYLRDNNINMQLTTFYKIIDNVLYRSISSLRKKYPNEEILDIKNTKFLKTEIAWIKACNYMELEEYQNADRVGRSSNINVKDSPKLLRKNSTKRRAIYELMVLYRENLMKSGYCDFGDVSLFALKYLKDNKHEEYTHIIIDESQDLSKVQLEILKELYKNKQHSSILFVADIAQNIYPNSWLVKGRSFASIGFDMKGKSNSLSKNYRTTKQVAECAYSLVEKDNNIVSDENYVKPAFVDRQGSYPIYKRFISDEKQGEFIINEVINLRGKYPLKDIAIVAKNKNILLYMQDKLNNKAISSSLINNKDGNFEEQSIKLVTLHSVKGLEFKVVFIASINEKVIPYLDGVMEEDRDYSESIERKLLYVGMTRANDLLYLSSSATPSLFIEEINSDYLKMSRNNEFSIYKNINIDDYQFKDRIQDIYGREEKVRQWVINQLINRYKYPLELIDIEYRVNSFSKVGYVDIVVNIYKNNNKTPFIFIETKQLYAGVEDAISQLKSYLSADLQCQYGIATDGNELTILSRDYKRIDDIPCFDNKMMPSSLDFYKYIDLKHNKVVEIIKDSTIPDELRVVESGEGEEYSKNDIKTLPIFSEIAAGNPIMMNDRLEDGFTLPSSWFTANNDYYILKVKGDSMIDVNIDNGDYVVLKHQNTAINGDIVAADIDGEKATLKTYVTMGENILLMPQNPNYEPIMLNREEARIMGIVEGIVKKESEK
ncbi:transcriptional repressor LexA [Clostridium sp. DL1XJH146]